MRSLLRLAVFALCFVLPSLAHAHLRLARDHDHDDPERKGVVVGFMLQPGVAQFGRGFVPATRFRYVVGGGVSERVTLTAEMGVQVLHGYKKPGYTGDVVATGFLGRGFFVRAGAGVVSHALADARDPLKPGIGGLLGIGYEFRPLERFAVALGVDYDIRMRTDRLPSQALLVGLRMGAYLRK